MSTFLSSYTDLTRTLSVATPPTEITVPHPRARRANFAPSSWTFPENVEGERFLTDPMATPNPPTTDAKVTPKRKANFALNMLLVSETFGSFSKSDEAAISMFSSLSDVYVSYRSLSSFTRQSSILLRFGANVKGLEVQKVMATSKVKYVGQKVSKVRWSPSGHLTQSKIFASGGWDNQVCYYGSCIC